MKSTSTEQEGYKEGDVLQTVMSIWFVFEMISYTSDVFTIPCVSNFVFYGTKLRSNLNFKITKIKLMKYHNGNDNLLVTDLQKPVW